MSNKSSCKPFTYKNVNECFCSNDVIMQTKELQVDLQATRVSLTTEKCLY